METPLILHVETATNLCSVALSKGNKLVDIRESDEDKSHARLLACFIDELLKDNNLQASDLDAISVSEGPGSYTGLRIGVSTVKGLCYGLNIPLIMIPTLQSLAYSAYGVYGNKYDMYCPMLDARRMEVYTALYTNKVEEISPVKALVVEDNVYEKLLSTSSICFFGDGADKCSEILNHENAHFCSVQISAKGMIIPALEAYNNKKFVDLAYSVPFYLKDFVSTTPKKNILGI